MGRIYFTAGLFENTLRIIRESHDCRDVANDLERIQKTIDYGFDFEAAELDNYLRRKYPIIDKMLNIADSIQVHSYPGDSDTVSQSSYKSRLEQDYCGILCQVSIEKGFAQNLESCIDHVG